MNGKPSVELLQAQAALAEAVRAMPELTIVKARVEVVLSNRVDTAAVFRSGRVVVNPDWFGKLAAPDRVFVMAHELFHLFFRTHERVGDASRRRFNLAHDAIINDRLKRVLGREPPDGGFWLPGAEGMSAEELYAKLRPELLDGGWRYDVLPDSREDRILGRRRSREQVDTSDAISVDTTLADEPILAADTMGRRTIVGWARSRIRSDRDAAIIAAMERFLGTRVAEVRARSYSRPSRRGEGPRPGPLRLRHRIGVILDVSSSMVGTIARARAAVESLASNAGPFRLVQTDGEVRSDTLTTTGAIDLANCTDSEVVIDAARCERCDTHHAHRVHGRTTSLEAALGRLRSVDALVVVTDGLVTIPDPYRAAPTLWLLTRPQSGASGVRPGSTVVF